MPLTWQLQPSQPSHVDVLSRITNSLSLAVTSLSTTGRAHALFNESDTSLNDSFSEEESAMAIR
jgi:hypothetical protein